MRTELMDVYSTVLANPQDKDMIRHYHRTLKRVAPQIVIDEILGRDELIARVKTLEEALDTIQSGFEYRHGAPRMNGTFERDPHVIDRKRMMELAREALGER